jgi:hypothetical protein
VKSDEWDLAVLVIFDVSDEDAEPSDSDSSRAPKFSRW